MTDKQEKVQNNELLYEAVKNLIEVMWNTKTFLRLDFYDNFAQHYLAITFTKAGTNKHIRQTIPIGGGRLSVKGFEAFGLGKVSMSEAFFNAMDKLNEEG